MIRAPMVTIADPLNHAYDPVTMDTARRWFRAKWVEINGQASWDENPDVVVLPYEMVEE